RDRVQQHERLTGRIRQIQASTRLRERTQGALDGLGLSRAVYGRREFLRMRCHHTEVDLSRTAGPRFSHQEEWDLAERLAAVEGPPQARHARELTVVGRPVSQGDTKLLDAQWSLGTLQRAKRMRRANEPVGAGRRGRRQQAADPLCKYGPPGCL